MLDVKCIFQINVHNMRLDVKCILQINVHNMMLERRVYFTNICT